MLYEDSWKNAGHNHDESVKYTELNGYNKHCFTSQNQHVKIASLPKENKDGWCALFYFNRDITLVTSFIVHSSGLWFALSFN